jgi:hypothetical protein
MSGDVVTTDLARRIFQAARSYMSALPDGTEITDELQIAALKLALTSVGIGPLIDKTKSLVDAVQFDDCGRMVGQEWRGGNGGQLSRETLRVADSVRQLLPGGGA